MMKKLHLKIFAVLFLYSVHSNGQDIHMTQFDHSFRTINPALTGIFDGEHRLEANYRKQWKGVPVEYLTFMGSYDSKIQPKKSETSMFGYGFNLNYDRAGYSKLSLLQLGLNGSYSHFLNPNNILSGGLQIGLEQRTLNESDLSFDRQYANGQYNESLPTGENFDKMNTMFATISAGVNYRYQTAKNSLNVGVGLYNINTPDQNFFDVGDPSNLPLRTSLYGDLWMGVTKKIRWNFVAGSQWQSSYEELVFGTKFEFHVNEKRGDDLYLTLGGYGRFSELWDAYSPYVGVRYNSFDIGITYDVNVSKFKIATDRRGGPEIWVRYIIKNVDEVKDFKTCRIY